MKRPRRKIKTARVRSDGFAKDIVYSIKIDQIRANAAQPRKDFDIESIIKLADSIRRYGILQPLSVRRIMPAPQKEVANHPPEKKKNIVADVLSASLSVAENEPNPNEDCGKVSRETQYNTSLQLRIPDFIPELGSSKQSSQAERETPLVQIAEEPTEVLFPRQTAFLQRDTGQYELIAGERRLRAAKMLGMSSVPCIVVDVNDAISAELALVENMLRENLNMFELAVAFSHLSEKYSLTQEEIASKMSLSQSAVANKIRLLKLTPVERELILEGDLTERHARAFLRIQDASLRLNCIHYVIDRKLNVNETDKYISTIISQQKETAEPQREVAGATPSPEKLCTNIYKFINRMQSVSGNYLVVNRKSDSKSVIITLTVRKDS